MFNPSVILFMKNISKNFRSNLINIGLIGLFFLIIFGCVCRSGRESVSEKSSQAEPKNFSASTPEKDQSKTKFKDEGDFLVDYVDLKNLKYEQIANQVKEEKLLEDASERLNKALILPFDITLRAKDCEEINASYNPNDRSITVCYELMEHFYKTFKSAGRNDETASQNMFDSVRFVFLHELGHALIDAYQLPITGNEEDSADRLSSYICLEELGELGIRSAIAITDQFAIETKLNPSKKRDFYDEHLLGEQRLYNILCMIYGSDAEKHKHIVENGHLPRERAEKCQSEYDKTSQGWKNLLKPYRKN